MFRAGASSSALQAEIWTCGCRVHDSPAAFSLSIIIFGARYVCRTRSHTTVGTVQALLSPRNTGDTADIRSRICPHGHLALTPTSDIINPTMHDSFVTEARELTASVNPQQRAKNWKRLAIWTGKCTEMVLPRQDVEFVTFIQSVTLCAILAGLYGVDPDTLSLLDVAFMTNALNCRSDRASLLSVGKLAAMTRRIYRWVRGERASRALDIIFPAYESMWRIAAVTLDYANRDQHMRNAFLDLNENPTENQFRVFKVKDTKPSVEAVMKEVLRLHPPMCHIMRKSRHPWWRRLFYSKQEIADIASAHRSSAYGAQPETFDAMRFHSKRPTIPRLLAFGYGGLSCVAEEWAPMATALIVAKVIDRVDDVCFILAGDTFDTGVDHNISTRWDGWVIRKKEKARTSSPPQVTSGSINPNVESR